MKQIIRVITKRNAKKKFFKLRAKFDGRHLMGKLNFNIVTRIYVFSYLT